MTSRLADGRVLRLVAADDHELILDALDRLFEAEEDVELVARCRSGLEAVEAVAEHDPHVLLLDLDMPGLDGFGVMRRLRASGTRTRIVVLAGSVSDADLAAAIRLGARGVVLKAAGSEAVVDCVRMVHSGRICIDPRWMARAMRHHAAASDLGLTSRELEVVSLVAAGLHNRDVGQALKLTEGTVKVHLHNVYSKLGIHSRMELLRVAQQLRQA